MRNKERKKWRIILLTVAFCLFGTVLYQSEFFQNIWFHAERAERREPVMETTIITELEQIKKDRTKPRGSKENPFVILEIVPYKGVAEFGYQLEGAEPIEIDKMLTKNSSTEPTLDTLKSMGTADVKWVQKTVFLDEKEELADSWEDGKETTLYGYYEYVGNGRGNFNQNNKQWEKMEKTTEGKGSIVWHSVYGMKETDTEPGKLLKEAGERWYTKRTDKGTRKGGVYEYKNKNNFLKRTLGLSSESEMENYYVYFKTIEPHELNQNLQWIDKANLISFQYRSHNEALVSMWEKYGKDFKQEELKKRGSTFGTYDISWEAAEKIFKKVVAKEDYVSVIYDWNFITEGIAGRIGDLNTKKVTTQIYDFNKKVIGENASLTGSNNNVFKLGIMLRTMDPVLFHNLFFYGNDGEEKPLIANGKYSLQKDIASTYWTQYTFLMVNPAIGETGKNPYTYWNDNEQWNEKRLDPEVGNSESVHGHVFTYNGDNTMTSFYATGAIADTKYSHSFLEYLKEKNDTDKSPASAVEYIIGPDQRGKEEKEEDEFSVLDIEPCNEFTMDSFALRWYLPSIEGKIVITPMTSSEFIGRIEDINSKYDLIYMGLNRGAFRLKDFYIDSVRTKQLPVYNDSTLDGKIYLHVGDKIISGEKYSVKWLKNSFGTTINDTTCRLPGNDISNLKKEKLEDFLKAGLPILMDSDLYRTETSYTKKVVDTSSNVYRFVKENKMKYNNLASEENAGSLSPFINPKRPKLILLKKPNQYNGEDNNSDGTIDKPNYINTTENGDSKEFTFTFRLESEDEIKDKSYGVRLFVDVNGDGHFDENEKSEVIYSRERGFRADGTEYTIPRKGFSLPDVYIGAIPWKLEIFDSGNRAIRKVETGYCAVKRSKKEKEKIRVLQINANYNSTLVLKEDEKFKKYTSNLNDYTIQFETKTIEEYEEIFKQPGNEFHKNEPIVPSELKDYNMLILGFADMYDGISNQYGALDYIQYFIDQGKSVLFTHDVTSLYNSENQKGYGYHASVYFRETLGMDRFGARTPLLYSGTKLKEELDKKDKATKPDGRDSYKEIHGYTYYALKRIAQGGYLEDAYGYYPQYMNFKDLKIDNDDNCATNRVERLNEGQITHYPYEIDPGFETAVTHGQYFQLNPEDEKLTVWYCLAEDKIHKNSNVYGVSPKDATNNYYIYNRGNVTYSGVGHSKVTNDMEVRLFVNTMIASYRASYKPPVVLVENEGTVCLEEREGKNTYYLYLNKDFSKNETDTFEESGTQQIVFVPWEVNLLSENLEEAKIYMEDGTRITSVLDLDSGRIINADKDNVFSVKSGNSLVSGRRYAFNYENSNYNIEGKRKVIIYAKNVKNQVGVAEVEIKKRSLFLLD